MTADGDFLSRWFAILDSDRPSDILELISDDFELSIVFSSNGHAEDFSGDRAALVGYLEQRERGIRTHHKLAATVAGSDELFLGEVRRSGEFEATFVAAGRVGSTGKLRRLLIGRSPGVAFGADHDADNATAGSSNGSN